MTGPLIFSASSISSGKECPDSVPGVIHDGGSVMRISFFYQKGKVAVFRIIFDTGEVIRIGHSVCAVKIFVICKVFRPGHDKDEVV